LKYEKWIPKGECLAEMAELSFPWWHAFFKRGVLKKKKTQMKSIKHSMLLFAVAAGIAFAPACSNNRTNDDNKKTNEDPKETAEDHNDAKFTTNNSEKDAQFLVDAAEVNLEEVSMGKLAASQGMTKEVRELGEMMNREHQKAYDDLSALAKKKSITIPSAVSDDAQKKYNNLSEKRGSDFDKDFCDAMVNGHKDAIDKFEHASKESTDPDIQTWASNMLPALRTHLDHSMNCQQKLSAMK
jgi:putative membrane protein